MESQGIIRKVTGHSDWCSSMTYVTKKDGSLRMCLDPQKLNQALKRCPHKIPTVEEITPAFAGAKYFTKLDAKAGYWSIQLSAASQELTTFRTPVGRYCFRRLPFGLRVSQDLFQQEMDNIIEQVPGCVGISDDVVICGETEEQHDECLIQFCKVAQKHGLMLNSTKCAVKCDRINFFGRMYTSKGLFPDSEKIEDIIKMPTPRDKQDLHRFLGMVNFLSVHIPNLSTHTSTLRNLGKKDVPFQWDDDYQVEYDNIKKLVANNTGLRYYNPKRDVILEVDASINGLGAVLIQDKAPVAFASKALTPTQAQYSNIERECLAIVHGIEHFHNYLYGRYFVIHSDHKPLEMILRKPLHVAPPRLQRMLTKIQGYDFDILYQPGQSLVLADTLSRLPNEAKSGDVEVDHRVDSIVIDDISLDLINFSPVKQTEIREETARDPVLRSLLQTIYSGWPDKMQELPKPLREYWSYRDELAVENGIIFKGRQVIIPEPLHKDILTQLHASHQGIDKTRRLARESVSWPGINRDVEATCRACELCQEMQASQAKQLMMMHKKPMAPWVKLGTDLFTIDGKDFLIISDYYSRYPIIKKLTSTTAASIVSATKEALSLLGVPREIISDNGPQFQREYNQFCDAWGMTHSTSKPRYAQSNGFIERQIRYLKPIIKKCLKSGGDIEFALLNVRATPLDSVLPSPAELMFGRPIQTTMPSRSSIIEKEEIRNHIKEYRSPMPTSIPKTYHRFSVVKVSVFRTRRGRRGSEEQFLVHVPIRSVPI